MQAVWMHKGYPHPAEVSKGSLGRCVPVEKQRSRSSLSPLPGRSILPLLPALSSIKLRATGRETYIFQPLSKIRGQRATEEKKANSWAAVRTKSCSKQRLFSLGSWQVYL